MLRLILALCLVATTALAQVGQVHIAVQAGTVAPLTFTSLANGTAGGSPIAGSGAYTGTAPTSISTATWGGGCSGSSTVTSFSASGGAWSADFSVPGSAGTSCTIAITDNRSDMVTSPGVTISASGDWTLITSGACTPVGTTGCAVTLNTTGANLIVANVAMFSSSGAPPTFGDNKSNTFTLAVTSTYSLSNCWDRLYQVISPTVGTGHTFTLGNGSTSIYGSLVVEAWKDTVGVPTASTSSSAENNALTSGQTPAFTPGANNALVVSGLCTNSPATAQAVNSPFTMDQSITPILNTYYGAVISYYKQTTVAAVQPTYTWTGTADVAITGFAVSP